MKKTILALGTVALSLVLALITIIWINDAAVAQQENQVKTLEVSDKVISEEEIAQIEAEKAAAEAKAKAEEEARIAAEKKAAEEAAKASKWILVGDSRGVGMNCAVFGALTYSGTVIGDDEDGNTWIAKGSMGLAWMKEMESEIESSITQGCAVVINMGTNDAYSYSYTAPQYVSYLNEMAPKWKALGAKKVYFMSTNPVDDAGAANWTALRNSHVVAFNEAVKEGLSDDIIYLDCYSYLQQQGWSAASGDGVHYTSSTYQKIYDYICDNV